MGNSLQLDFSTILVSRNLTAKTNLVQVGSRNVETKLLNVRIWIWSGKNLKIESRLHF